jgi:hypothetical protein
MGARGEDALAGTVDWIEVALGEYRALRAEVSDSLLRQRVIIAAGLTAIAVLVGLGLVAEAGSRESTAALVVGAPLAALLMANLWADEQAGMLRTQKRLLRLERTINARVPLDPPPLHWEPRGTDERSGRRLLMTFLAGSLVLLLVAGGSAALGITERNPGGVALVLLLAIAALPLLLTTGVLVVVWRWLKRSLDELGVTHVVGVALGRADGNDQVSRNVAVREQFLRDYDAYSPQDLFPGDAASADAQADRLLFERQAFALDRGDETLFPRFQFDDAKRPLPVVAEVLRAFGEADPVGRWELALWFTTASPALEGGRPADRMRKEPARVVEAAHADFQPVTS